jgi:hypothetical protein
LDNKILLSISLIALIQTLKAAAEMVKLIYNMSTANTGYKYKDNSDKRSLPDKSVELARGEP